MVEHIIVDYEDIGSNPFNPDKIRPTLVYKTEKKNKESCSMCDFFSDGFKNPIWSLLGPVEKHIDSRSRKSKLLLFW